LIYHTIIAIDGGSDQTPLKTHKVMSLVFHFFYQDFLLVKLFYFF